MPYDVNTGEWYDEEEVDPFGMNMFLGSGAYPAVPMDVNKKTGANDPYGIQTAGRQANYTQDVLQMLFDPRLAMLASLQGGAPAFDYNAFLGGGVGGAGGMGGGGGQVWTTPRLDSAEASGDPLLADYARRIRGGENPEALKMELIGSNLDDQAKVDTYGTAIDEMFQEQAGFQRNAMQPREQTPAEQAWAKAGLPSPLEQYSADNLPQDMELYSASAVNPWLESQGSDIRGMEKQLKALQEQARYAPQRTMKSQILPGVGALKGFGGAGAAAAAQAPPPASRAERAGIYGDLMVGPHDRTGGAATATPDTGATLYGLASTLRNAVQDRQAGIERDMPYVIDRGGVDSSGKRYSKVRGNQAALQASRQERSIGRKKARQASVEQEVRGYYARQAQKQGRSPSGDAMQARLNALRQMGLGL